MAEKMDIVDFVEESCGIKLRDYQKLYIKELEKNQEAIIFPRKRSFPYWYVCYLACREEYKEYEKLVNERSDI